MTNEVLSNEKLGTFLGICDSIMAWSSIKTIKRCLMSCLKEDTQK